MSFYKDDTQEDKKQRRYKMDLDKIKIDKLIKEFYSTFSNKDKEPNLKLLYETCIDKAIIIKNTNGLSDIYNLENFIAPRKEILTNGALIEFEEFEIGEQTTITRNIAQRLSHYQKDGILNDQPFSMKGTKIFQVLKTRSVWKICCVIWDDE